MTRRGHAPQFCAAFIEEVKRSGVQAEKFRHLPQRAVQRIAEVQRLRQGLGNRVQHHEFAVTSADFKLRLFTLRNVLKETLVGSGIPRGVTDGEGGLQHGARFAVFAAHLKFKIGYRAMLLQQSLESFPVCSILVKPAGNVDGQ